MVRASDSQSGCPGFKSPVGSWTHNDSVDVASSVSTFIHIYTHVYIFAAELPEGDGWRVDEREVRKRRDLRDSHLVFSIDPQGCEDVDDTLSVRYIGW